MKKLPQPKLTYFKILHKGNEIARTEPGVTSSNPDGSATFLGYSLLPDGKKIITEIELPPALSPLQSAGKPHNSAAKNMTRILAVHIEAAKQNISATKAAEQSVAVSSRDVYFDARRQAKPYVRIIYAGVIDGDWHAFAFMHDGKNRGKNPTGPHWVLKEGSNKSYFKDDVMWEVPAME